MRITVNKIKCKRCGDVVISEHRHDLKSCKCGDVAVDGGTDYLRRILNSPSAAFVELSEYESGVNARTHGEDVKK